ncbi:protein MAIN-LIKE 2 isoform X2 [Lathyrus oleraceus]|uniref:protein MAIN-LIKE 2 isoform X2 n=1 Tax=Pisum sativum TaxID=3888 RepID=UPI0021CFF8C8|nr:protein MAIN-LIKE 2-like isoform X2 [Pisum sativum]
MDPETVFVDITSFAMKLNKFTHWTVDPRVKEEVEKTCFKYFMRFPEGKLNMPNKMIAALLRFYENVEEHFVFGDTKIDLGLEDVMYITGLPIDGKQISGIEPKDPIDTIVNHLAVSPVEANDLLLYHNGKKSHDICLKSLEDKFKNIAVTEENVNSHVKAYLLFLLGNLLFTTSSFDSVSAIYLPFLEVHDIDSYAWGAAVLATLKVSMNKVRQGNKTLNGFAYLLLVFAFERFKCLRKIFELNILPSQFPLMLGWVNLTFKTFKVRSLMPSMTTCYEKLREMTDEDVDLLPYKRDGLEVELPDQFKRQSWMVYAKVYTICFNNIAKHPVHICWKQLGLERGHVRKSFGNFKRINLQERGPEKDKDWRKFNPFYTNCNTRWTKRNMFLIKKDVIAHEPLVNYVQEDDEIETEEPTQENTSPISTSPPMCNLESATPQDPSTSSLRVSTPQVASTSRFRAPTPRDEVQVQTLFSNPPEALSIEKSLEVLSFQISPQPTDDDFDNDHFKEHDEDDEGGNHNDEGDEGGNHNDDEDDEGGNNNNNNANVGDDEVGNNNIADDGDDEVGNNNNADDGDDNHNYDEGEHNNNVKNYIRGEREGILRPKPPKRTVYSPDEVLRVRNRRKLRKPKN